MLCWSYRDPRDHLHSTPTVIPWTMHCEQSDREYLHEVWQQVHSSPLLTLPSSLLRLMSTCSCAAVGTAFISTDGYTGAVTGSTMRQTAVTRHCPERPHLPTIDLMKPVGCSIRNTSAVSPAVLNTLCFHCVASLGVKKPRRSGISKSSGITEQLFPRQQDRRCCVLAGRSRITAQESPLCQPQQVTVSQSHVKCLFPPMWFKVASVSSHDRSALHCGKTNEDSHTGTLSTFHVSALSLFKSV